MYQIEVNILNQLNFQVTRGVPSVRASGPAEQRGSSPPGRLANVSPREGNFFLFDLVDLF
jgi:hypothetical protein